MAAENVETTKVEKKNEVTRTLQIVDADLKVASDSLKTESDRYTRMQLKCQIDDLLDERLTLTKK